MKNELGKMIYYFDHLNIAFSDKVNGNFNSISHQRLKEKHECINTSRQISIIVVYQKVKEKCTCYLVYQYSLPFLESVTPFLELGEEVSYDHEISFTFVCVIDFLTFL